MQRRDSIRHGRLTTRSMALCAVLVATSPVARPASEPLESLLRVDLIAANEPVYRDSSNQPVRPARGRIRPLSLASGDFNGDGVADLACGYATASGGLLAIRFVRPGTVHPWLAETRTSEPSDPFRREALLITLEEAPERLVAGDFNGDGRADLIHAAAGARQFHVLLANGAGGFSRSTAVRLPGAIKALGIGEFGVPDGVADIAVGLERESGPGVMVFRDGRGALMARGRLIELPMSPGALVFGRFGRGFTHDLAIAGGDWLVLIHGPRNVLDERTTGSVDRSAREIETQRMGTRLVDLAAGDFTSDPGHELAALGEDGTVRLLVRRGTAPARWSERIAAPGGSARGIAGGRLVRTRVSAIARDDLISFDPGHGGLGAHLFEPSPAIRARTGPGARRIDIETSLPPVAVLPMRLNGDALTDLAILTTDSMIPTLAMTRTTAALVVNAPGDDSDADTDDGICDSDLSMAGSQCTLRAALEQAEALLGLSLIEFTINEIVHNRSTPLPELTQSIVIDGTTAGRVLIRGVGNGISLSGGSSMVRGLALAGYDLNTGHALRLRGSGGNVIEDVIFGTDLTGETNDPGLRNFVGLRITNSDGNTIGGTADGAGNVISGSTVGLLIEGGSDNVAVGNRIGTNALGSGPIANVDGVVIVNTAAGAAMNNSIGRPIENGQNIISGNTGVGVFIRSMPGEPTASGGNLVSANRIGSKQAVPPDAFGNGGPGVLIRDSAMNEIGGGGPFGRNLISGNGSSGIEISGTGSTGNLIQGNAIGVGANGTVALGNGEDGVFILNGARDNLIGDFDGGGANIIAFNSRNGVTVSQTSSRGNAIRRNVIHSNGGLGIELTNGLLPSQFDGVTDNDALDSDTGANGLQNFPEMNPTRVSNTAAAGVLRSAPNGTYRLEFFSAIGCDPAGNGEGGEFVGFTVVQTDALGEAEFAIAFETPPQAGGFITATATDALGNTSEFSSCEGTVLVPNSVGGSWALYR